MQYDEYKNRMLKIARVLKWIRRHIVLLSIIMGVIVSATVATLALKGTVLSSYHPSTLVYGETAEPQSNAFLSKTYYEYCGEDGKWTETQPIFPGEYTVRCCGTDLVGNPRYGDEAAFVITPKRIEVSVGDARVTYGELPSISADTAYNDYAVCEKVDYENITKKITNVIPIKGAVHIFNSEGEDVTHAYEIKTVAKEITISPRPITITVSDDTQTYDAQEHSYKVYALTAGTLAEGDVIQAVFNQSLTDVGSVTNTPELVVLNEKAKDVTLHYTINEVIGTLTVAPRPLHVEAGSLSTTYTGNEITVSDWTVSESTPLANGHKLVLESSATFIDAGTYETQTIFRVKDSAGNDKTSNYSINVTPGTVEILQKQLEVITPSDSWVYDAMEHESTEVTTKGKIDAHRYEIVNKTTITEAGSTENNITVKIYQDTVEVTHNYAIQYTLGTLTVEKRKITVYPETVTEVYDGTEKTGTNALVSESSPNQPVDGHTLYCTITGSQTDVGESASTITEARVLNGDVDVTANYDIETLEGSITVTPRPIHILVSDAEKVYDGEALTSTDCEAIPVEPLTFALVEGHILSIVANGSQTDAGYSTNMLQSFSVTDSEGNDKTANYEAASTDGTLTVTQRPIRVTVKDAEKTYDGTPLVSNEIEVTPVDPLTFALVEGHEVINVVTDGSQTDVGESENHLSEYEIVDSSGNDISFNYSVETVHGTLTVYGRIITVQSGSAEKQYDGTPLTCDDEIIVTEGELLEGHYLDMSATGSQTEPGASPNTIAGIIVNADGDDVSHVYTVTYDLGTLRVFDTPPGGGDDGDPGDGDGEDGPTEPFLILKVKSDRNGIVYFKDKSYGNYLGNSWENATPYYNLLGGEYSYQYLTGIALQNAGYTPSTIRIQSMVSSYYLPYYLARGSYDYEKQTNDTINYGNVENEYTVGYYYYHGNGTKLTGNLGTYSDEELEYRDFVEDYYLWVDDETKAFLQEIIDSQGFSISDPDVINNVAEYVKSAAEYSDAKTSELDLEANIVKAFLSDEYKEGVCRHFAAAATLIYRTLGIPARYTVGYAGRTVAGEWVEMMAPGHAWTEIYINGVGWIAIEVTPAAIGNEEARTINISPQYQYKYYDGTPLEAQDLIVPNQLLADLIGEGYTYDVTVTGSQTEPGKGESTITKFTLFDPNGIDVTDSYIIVREPGVLEVIEPTMSILNVELYQLQKYYDGTPLYFEEGDYDISGLRDGHRLEFALNIYLTEVGSLTLNDIQNNSDYYSYSVYEGDLDVTDQYTITFKAPATAPESYLPIRVDARPLELSANSVSKSDNGTTLEPDGLSVTKGNLLYGHTIQAFIINGSQTGPGSTECEIDPHSIVIVDQYGNDVTRNYSITCKPGTLEIFDPYS